MSKEKTVEFEKGLVEFFIRFIDTMSQRGNIRGDELTTVGQVRNIIIEKYKNVFPEDFDKNNEESKEES